MLARTDWIAGHSHNLSKHNDLVHCVRPGSFVRADSLAVRVPFRRHYHCGAAASLVAARLTIFPAFRPPRLSPAESGDKSSGPSASPSRLYIYYRCQDK
jgi:hypothetical protein